MAEKQKLGRQLTPNEVRLRNEATHVAIASEDIKKLRAAWLSADARMLEIHEVFKKMEFVRKTDTPGTPAFLEFLGSHTFLVAMCTRWTGEACQVGNKPGVFTSIANTLLTIWETFDKQDREHRAELLRLGIPAPETSEAVGEEYRTWRNEPHDGK